ncbi:PLP-dependent aminotransferase family protein [Paenarthrobacter sp. NPDC018779]|uniref:aminotransferase-like domain-containing protein n=1 Tax=Paenarthrobacter sp. NPDC018779 TaxID=3364375 RepID=UPI0037C728BD
MGRISDDQLAQLLRGWETTRGTKAEQIAGAILEVVRAQEISFGSALPAERAAASALGVSRATVADAYGILKEQGVLQSLQGSGWRVHRPNVDSTKENRDRIEPERSLDGFAERPTSEATSGPIINLSSGALPGLALVAREWKNIELELIDQAFEGDGYEPRGMPRLREEIARRYTLSGRTTDADEILITSGSQQALEIISRAWIDDGDPVVVEDPTYRGALDAFRSRGARLYTVPMEPNGLDVSALERIARHTAPRFVYTLPVSHNPTGINTSSEKLKAISAIATERGLMIVEDMSTADLALTEEIAPLPLHHAIDAPMTITIGSMSKLFWGGLRIGWIRGPKPVIARFQRHKVAMDLGTSIPSQTLALQLLPHTTAARQERLETLRKSLKLAEYEITSRFPYWSWTEPSGGSGLWVRAPGVNMQEIARTALRAGVRLTPGPSFSAVGAFDDYLRLPFWSADSVKTGLERLAAVIK